MARQSGASRSTVSRVINGSPRVSPAVVERVRSAVAELGFVPNQAARSLVTRRNNAIAVVVTEPQNRLFVDPFFDRHLRGIRQELVEQGAQLVLLLIEEPDDYPRVGNFLGGRHVDGALLFSLRVDDPLPETVDRMGLPAVFGGGHCPAFNTTDTGTHTSTPTTAAAPQKPSATCSPRAAHIATITGPLNQAAAIDRLDGYRDVLPDSPPHLIAEGDFTVQGGADAMRQLLNRSPGLDAVFAASDLMARGALRTLKEHGRSVPDDVAVIGFDDLPPLEETSEPLLTTVHQDIEGMGRLMARLLFQRIQATDDASGTRTGHRPHPVITPTHLVLRETA